MVISLWTRGEITSGKCSKILQWKWYSFCVVNLDGIYSNRGFIFASERLKLLSYQKGPR